MPHTPQEIAGLIKGLWSSSLSLNKAGYFWVVVAYTSQTSIVPAFWEEHSLTINHHGGSERSRWNLPKEVEGLFFFHGRKKSWICDLLAKDAWKKFQKIFSQMEDFMSLLVISHGSKKHHLEQIQQIEFRHFIGEFPDFCLVAISEGFSPTKNPPILLIRDRKNDQTPDVMQLFPIDLFGLIDPLRFKNRKNPVKPCCNKNWLLLNPRLVAHLLII